MAEKSHPPDKNSKDSGHLVNNGSELSESAGEGHSLGVASGVGGGYSSALGNGSSVGVEEFGLAEHPTEGNGACFAIGTMHNSLHKDTKPSGHPSTGTASYPELPLLELAEDFLGVCSSNSYSGDPVLLTYADPTSFFATHDQAAALSAGTGSPVPMEGEETISTVEESFIPHKSEMVGMPDTAASHIETFGEILEENNNQTTTTNSDLEDNFRRSEQKVLELTHELKRVLQWGEALVRRVEDLKVAIKTMNENYRLDVAKLEKNYEAEISDLEEKLERAETEEERKVIEVSILKKQVEKERHLRCLEEARYEAEHEATMALLMSISSF